MKDIVIKRLRIEGKTYRRTLKFKNDINVIAGDINSGKSLILRLIDYALGKDKLHLTAQVALYNYCDKVYLEIESNSKKYVIRRNLLKDKSKFYIFYCGLDKLNEYSPKVLEKSELSTWLLELLGIPSFKIIKNKVHSEDKTLESLSIRDILRFTYVDQFDLGTHNFLKANENLSKKNKDSLDALFNFIAEDKEGIKNKITDTTNEINLNKKIIHGLKTYLKESGFKNYKDVIKTKNELELKISKCNFEKRNIIKQNTSVEPNSIFEKLVNDRKDLFKQINKLDNQISSIQSEITLRIDLVNDYMKELRSIRATKEANYHLKTVEHIMICPLCNSKVTSFANYDFSDSDFNNMNIETKQKIEMVQELIENLKENIHDLKAEKEYLSNKLQNINRLIFKYDNSKIAGSQLEELESYNKMLQDLNTELSSCIDIIKVFNKINEKENEISEKEGVLLTFKKSMDELIINQNVRQIIMDEINHNYRKNLLSLGYTLNRNDTYISETDYIPYYGGASVYEHDSGGVLECIQIAYLCSIIQTALNKQEYGLKTPNILMLDTIGKFIGQNTKIHNNDNEEIQSMDEETYKKIYSLLHSIAKNTQVIIVDNTPPNEVKADYILKNKDKEIISSEGLINFSLNEIS